MARDTIKCINPATLEIFSEIPATELGEIESIVVRARKAQAHWASVSFRERGARLLAAREYLLANIDSFAEAITIDNGKPLVESISAEIYPVSDLLYYFARNSEKLLREKRIGLGIWTLLGRASKIRYQPYGVVGIISPWNYPFSIPVGAVATALMAGNSVILKPSSATAYVGKKIEEMFNAAGLPAGVFTHTPGASKVGEALLESPVDKIFFTGSTEVGHHVMDVCSKRLTPVNLELGGKDAMVVFPDANLDHASSAAVWGAFTNAGQCCASIERAYVHERAALKFTNLVVLKASKLKIGPGINPDTDVGPLTTESQLKIVETQVKDARKKGARILTGGGRPEGLAGYFFQPTVLSNVDHSFECVKEETFGPLLPIMTFRDEDEAVNLVNDSPYGLSAYIWTGNIKRARRLASKLRVGTVAINECVYTHALPQTPWGGVKMSGFGRTHGQIGLKEMANPLHIHTNFCTRFKSVWWYGYNAKLLKTFGKLARSMTGSITGKIRSMPAFLAMLLRK